jgi:hypothetical protein
MQYTKREIKVSHAEAMIYDLEDFSTYWEIPLYKIELQISEGKLYALCPKEQRKPIDKPTKQTTTKKLAKKHFGIEIK